MDGRFALLHGRVQKKLEDVQVGELITAFVLPVRVAKSPYDQLAHHLLVLILLLVIFRLFLEQMRDGRKGCDCQRLLLTALFAREQQERCYTSGGKVGATQLGINGQLRDENATRVDGVVRRV